MDLSTFVNSNWTVLAGIISFIFTAGYVFSQVRDISRLRESDYKDYLQKLKDQKEAHDLKISDLTSRVVAMETKVEDLKDKTFEVINSIQLDIREIMTILKGGKDAKPGSDTG